MLHCWSKVDGREHTSRLPLWTLYRLACLFGLHFSWTVWEVMQQRSYKICGQKHDVARNKSYIPTTEKKRVSATIYIHFMDILEASPHSIAWSINGITSFTDDEGPERRQRTGCAVLADSWLWTWTLYQILTTDLSTKLVLQLPWKIHWHYQACINAHFSCGNTQY